MQKSKRIRAVIFSFAHINNEKKRKAEKHHKYMMGGIVAKYFPKCYCFDEQELNHILSVVLAIRECKQAVENIEKERGE